MINARGVPMNPSISTLRRIGPMVPGNAPPANPICMDL